jgi:small subunit ribosomal protein S3Ae
MASKKAAGWKEKKLYALIAPENFESQEIGTTVSSTPDNLVGRAFNVTLGELIKDRSKNYMNLVFEISDVNGDRANTRFKNFFIPTGYLRSKVRKKTKKIDYSSEVRLNDVRVDVKLMVLSRHKVSEEQRSEIKALLKEFFGELEKDSLNDFLHKVFFGKLGTEVYKKTKTVCPIMRVEIYRIEALR